MSGIALGSGRIALGALALVAVATQAVDGSGEPSHTVTRHFSYFTVDSNLIGAAVLIVAGAQGVRGIPVGHRLDLWRGAAVLYLLATAIGYSVLLAADDDGLLSWSNLVVHYVVPIAVAVDWALDLPQRPIPFRRALVWMAFPTLWAAYTLLRGAIVDWYPYLFVDVGENGYLGALAGLLVVGAVMLAAIWALSWTTTLRRRAGVGAGRAVSS